MGPAGPAGAVNVGIRPEHITLGDSGTGQIDGTLDVLEYLGADTYLIVDRGATGKITVRLLGHSHLTPGTPLGLHFAPEVTHFFDSDGQALERP